jgi:ankyrin repeat protein
MYSKLKHFLDLAVIKIRILAFIVFAATFPVFAGGTLSPDPGDQDVANSRTDDIFDAARYGRLEIVKALVERNPNLAFSKDENGWTPLHVAALNGYGDMVQFLLANNAQVNAKDDDDQTPLCEATSNDHKDIVKMLLAKGAEVNVKADDGETPLHCAANKDVAQLLLTNKAKINAKDMGGETPLFNAARTGHKDLVELLLANGADVNAKDVQGDTPLFS